MVGASVAYHLAARGARDVVVLDRASGPGAGSTGRATGGFRVQFASAVNVRLSLLAREKLRRFGAETGGDCGYAAAGYLWIASDAAQLGELRAALAVQRANGVDDAREVGPDEIAALNPALRRAGIAGGTYCPSDGFIRPLGILAGYRAAAERLGARFVWDAPVTGLRRGRGGRIAAVRTAREEIAVERGAHRLEPPPAPAPHARHRRVPDEARAEPLGGRAIARQDPQRANEAVARAVRAADDPRAPQRRVERRDLVRADLARVVHAVGALHRQRRAQLRQLRRIGRDPQIAGRDETAVAAGLVGEAAQLLAREQRQPHVDRARELHAKAARRATGAAFARTRRAVEHDHVARAARGQVVRDARADDAGADDDGAQTRTGSGRIWRM